MDIQEQFALRMTKDWIEGPVRGTEQMHAIRFARAHRSAGDGLGSALVRLGHWMSGQPSLAPGRGMGSGRRAAQPAGVGDRSAPASTSRFPSPSGTFDDDDY